MWTLTIVSSAGDDRGQINTVISGTGRTENVTFIKILAHLAAASARRWLIEFSPHIFCKSLHRLTAVFQPFFSPVKTDYAVVVFFRGWHDGQSGEE